MIAERTSVLDILRGQVVGENAGARPVSVNGKEAGVFFEDDFCARCRVAPIVPSDTSLSREEQTRRVFESMAESLEKCGMAFTDIVRTWLYLDELLDWYDDFNRERTDFFQKNGTFDRVVPASTGIGAPNPAGAALIAGFMAMKPKDDRVTIRAIESPMQGSAMDYSSSFSRALEVATPSERTLFVSGTASIDKDGNSIHADDPRGQIQHTMSVVSAILESCSMTWQDASRGIVYYPDTSHHELFLEYCRENDIPSFPLALLESDICRKELVFEIEIDAVSVSPEPAEG